MPRLGITRACRVVVGVLDLRIQCWRRGVLAAKGAPYDLETGTPDSVKTANLEA